MLLLYSFLKCSERIYKRVLVFILKGLDENGFLVYNITVCRYVHILLSALCPHNANYMESLNGYARQVCGVR